MRPLPSLVLAAATLSISCQALGATRGIGLAVLVGLAGWLAHRSALAGGGTAGTGEPATGTTSDGTAGGDTAAGSSTGSGDTTGASGEGTDDTGRFETSACLSAPEPTTGTETEGDPDLGVCLCACDTHNDDGSDAAAFLLLPLLARRRRSRREVLDQVADQGRLPADVVARLRARMSEDEPPRPR